MMKRMKACLCVVLLGLAPTTLHAENIASPEVTRKANPSILAIPDFQPGNYRITSVNVNVPATLTVSEVTDRLKPRADIVWQGETRGNRYQQVDRIMTEALTRGVAGIKGKRQVMLDVTMTRFHAQTAMVRRTFGGEHEIAFTYVLRDARTGQALTPPATVKTAFRALAGKQALAAEASGMTQEVRIRAFVAKLIVAELGAKPNA